MGWMVGCGRTLKLFFESWFDWLAVLSRVELDGVWPEGLLDAYITIIPKVDATPLGQRPLCVLPVVYRIWTSVRLLHLDDWLKSWLPCSVFCAAGGRRSVEAWYSTALDFQEVLSGLNESHVHVFVADVVKSFDTADRGVLDLVLGRLGLPVWFRRAYFGYHANVRLRFKLACGLGSPWTWDGGIPQGCSHSMVFIVAWYLPWCRAFESIPGVRPQLYADNLKCVSGSPAALLLAADFTDMYIRLAGQEAAPKKCVFLSTSKRVRSDMKGWVVSDAGNRWTVKLDVRDLVVILILHLGPGLPRLGIASLLLSPGSLLLLFFLLRPMHISAALHGAEASLVSIAGLRRLTSVFGRPAMSGGLRLANPGAVLSLLDGPAGSDPGFHVVWCRFRMLRRHMAYNSSVHELARVY